MIGSPRAAGGPSLDLNDITLYRLITEVMLTAFMPIFEGGQTGMLSVRALLIQASASALALFATPALADDPPAGGQTDDTGISMDLDVLAKQLDIARQQIQPSLGATTYNFSPQALEEIPQGANAPLNQVLLQAPGVAQDSFGQIHLRGEHANVQYRLNGVELPEGLSVFGQAIISRFANSMSLITGALPAQYGFQTAGVVDIQTKTGVTNPGLSVTMYGGSWNWVQPSFEYGGRSGPVDWYITGDYLHNDRGIENPTSSSNAIHDTTNQFHGLAYVSGIIDPNTRVSMILGAFEGRLSDPQQPRSARAGLRRQRRQQLQQCGSERDPARAHRFRDHFLAEACERHRCADLGLCALQLAELLARLAGRSAVQRHRTTGEPLRRRIWCPE